MAQHKVPYQSEEDVKLSQITRQAVQWLARNGKWLLLGLVLGAAAGYIDQMITPDRYVGRMVGYSNNLNDVRIREFVADLDALRRGGRGDQLAKDLSLTLDEVRTLGGFDAASHNALESDLPFPPRETQTYFFAIDVKGTEPDLFPKIQQGIVQYINNSTYVKSRLITRRKSIQETIDKIDAELTYLESVKKQQEQAMSKGNVILGDMGSISMHIVNLEEKKAPLVAELTYMANEVVITKDVAVNPKPITPGPIRATVAGAAYGLAAIIALLALLGLVRMGREKN